MEFLPFLHVVSGSLALISFVMVLFTKKGKTTHRIIGMLFTFSCAFSSAAVISSSLIHNNTAFVPISLQTFIICLTGGMLASGVSHRPLLNSYLFISVLTSMWFAISGFMFIMENDFPANAVSQAIFFVINIAYAIRLRKSASQRTHSILMVQAAISAFTAFGMSTVAPLLGGGRCYYMILLAHGALQVWCWSRIYISQYRAI